MLRLPIKWAGPYGRREVIRDFDNWGKRPDWDGEDYGLYQIYGRHVLGDRNALLYIGQTTDQTFSARFQQHEEWLQYEWPVQVYLGRLYVPRRHVKKATWKTDVILAENILIYTYSPHYNGRSITERPLLSNRKVELVHMGDRHRIRRRDVVPNDWQ